MTGHFKKAGRGARCVSCAKFASRIRADETKVGDRVLVDRFAPGELVDVTGISKGKGFAGGVKRWHYRGGDATHGSMFHRAPGGIGAQLVSFARLAGTAFSGAHGQRARDGEKSARGESGRGREFAAGVRLGAGPDGRVILIRKARKAK